MHDGGESGNEQQDPAKYSEAALSVGKKKQIFKKEKAKGIK